MAAILGCIDSRVPHEIVFDKGVGDIFSARVAGNFVNTDILGSLEFATAAAGSKVVVVLGHTECGAVKGACDNVELGNLTATLANIAPAVYAVGDVVPGERSSKNPAFVQAVAHENVEMTVRNMVERSPIMHGLVEEGKLIVIGAMHDVTTGRVEFMDDTMITADNINSHVGRGASPTLTLAARGARLRSGPHCIRAPCSAPSSPSRSCSRPVPPTPRSPWATAPRSRSAAASSPAPRSAPRR